jgi:hypothetical protein
MPYSLYDVTVPAFRQQLGAVSALLDKAQAHWKDKDITESDIVMARLHEDMFPFSYQVKSTVVHSVGSLQALPNSVFSPDMSPPPDTIAALKHKVTEALQTLDAFTPAAINAFEGKDMAFQFKEFRLPFTAETFLASFSMPNFYFHATTAYAIMRNKGVAIGKRDFMGQTRIKTDGAP